MATPNRSSHTIPLTHSNGGEATRKLNQNGTIYKVVPGVVIGMPYGGSGGKASAGYSTKDVPRERSVFKYACLECLNWRLSHSLQMAFYIGCAAFCLSVLLYVLSYHTMKTEATTLKTAVTKAATPAPIILNAGFFSEKLEEIPSIQAPKPSERLEQVNRPVVTNFLADPGYQKLAKEPGTCIVKSLSGFHRSWKDCNTTLLQAQLVFVADDKLEEAVAFMEKEDTSSVTTLIMNGYSSTRVIERLLTKFTHVKTIVLSIKLLHLLNPTLATRPEIHKNDSVAFPNLSTLYFFSYTGRESFAFSWILRWHMPMLQNMIFANVNAEAEAINPCFMKKLEEFVRNKQRTAEYKLKHIWFKASFVDENRYEHLRKTFPAIDWDNEDPRETRVEKRSVDNFNRRRLNLPKELTRNNHARIRLN